MAQQPRPIDWEASYGTDWVGVQASLVYAPTFMRARLEVQRRPLVMPNAIKKTELWAELPETMPRNARESLNAMYRILQDCESDYWVRYLRGRK